MKLKYTILGFIITLALCYFIGNLNYVRQCYDATPTDNCPEADYIQRIFNDVRQNTFADGDRYLVWLICALPMIAGLTIDYKRIKNDSN